MSVSLVSRAFLIDSDAYLDSLTAIADKTISIDKKGIASLKLLRCLHHFLVGSVAKPVLVIGASHELRSRQVDELLTFNAEFAIFSRPESISNALKNQEK